MPSKGLELEKVQKIPKLRLIKAATIINNKYPSRILSNQIVGVFIFFS